MHGREKLENHCTSLKLRSKMQAKNVAVEREGMAGCSHRFIVKCTKKKKSINVKFINEISRRVFHILYEIFVSPSICDTKFMSAQVQNLLIKNYT